MKNIHILLIALALGACAGTEATRVMLPSVSSAMKVRTSVDTVEVMTVSLPGYAEAAEISVQAETGGLMEYPDALWADDPARALTNAMVRHLTTITGAQVAAEPWPLRNIPQAELTIRVEQMAIMQTGVLNLSGQYAISNDEYPNRSRVRLFRFDVPVTDPTLTNIAAAHNQAWQILAEKIARDM